MWKKGAKRHTFGHFFASHAPHLNSAMQQHDEQQQQQQQQQQQSIVWPMAFDKEGRRIVEPDDSPAAKVVDRRFGCSPPLWKALDHHFPREQ